MIRPLVFVATLTVAAILFMGYKRMAIAGAVSSTPIPAPEDGTPQVRIGSNQTHEKVGRTTARGRAVNAK